MKKLISSVLLSLLALIMAISLVSCGAKRIETDEFIIELPAGYTENWASGEDMRIYTAGYSSSDMISITYWEYADAKDMCTSETPTNEEMSDALHKAYMEEMGKTDFQVITVGEYSLYEYIDMFDCNAAMYYCFAEDRIWTVEFSIEGENYEEFKKEIPAILSSFKVK